MKKEYCSVQQVGSYQDANDQTQEWQNLHHRSEAAKVMPQEDFTQVTIAGYQRENSCHGEVCACHDKSGTDGQRRDLTRNYTCNDYPRGIRYQNLRTKTHFSQDELMDQTQFSSSMLCTTSSSLSRPYQSERYWTAHSISGPNLSADEEGTCYNNNFDDLSPYLAVRLPPTPADTIHADEGPLKISYNNSGSPSAFPLEYKSKAGFQEAMGFDATIFRTAEEVPDEQQALLTPPPEQMLCSAEQNDHAMDEGPQATMEDTQYQPDGNGGMADNTNCYTESSALPIVSEDPDLDFLSNSWTTENINFLDNGSGLASTSVSTQPRNWDGGDITLPLAYPPLAFDPYYSAAGGIGSATFQEHPTSGPNGPPDYNFDQFGSYLQAPGDWSGTDPFQNPSPTFETHISPGQATSTNPGNDRTNHRSKSKDRMLIDLKQRGYSYKDIKVMGQFEEAESTLRGRYRTLTKPKEARVRKPEWGDREVSLTLQHLTRIYILTRGRFTS